jgi:hypothetical protein
VQVPTVCCQGQITLHNLISSPAVKLITAEFVLNFIYPGPVKV